MNIESTVVQEESGKVSLMRVMALLIVCSILAMFMAHNIVSLVNGGSFVSIGSEEAMLITGVLASKAAQSFSEHKKAHNQSLKEDK